MLSPVTEMVLDAFTEEVIAGVAFVVAEQACIAERSRQRMRIVLEGNRRFTLAAEATMAGTLGATQYQLHARPKEDGLNAGIIPVVEFGCGNGAGGKIGHRQIVPIMPSAEPGQSVHGDNRTNGPAHGAA